MTANEIYVLVLCVLVFVSLVTLFSILIAKIIKISMKMIRVGVDDDKLKREYDASKSTKKSKLKSALDVGIVVLLWGVLLFALISTIWFQVTSDNKVGNIPMAKVVKTDSMSRKNENNYYLEENGISNQIQPNDIVMLHALPAIEDIKLYDVIMYERDGELILHRVVHISKAYVEGEETTFMMQGDAVPMPDNEMVKYSQMKGIYRNERVGFIGSFVLFMQSPAGYLCIILVAIVTIVTPIIDQKILRASKERLVEIGYIDASELEKRPRKIKRSKREDIEEISIREGKDEEDALVIDEENSKIDIKVEEVSSS